MITRAALALILSSASPALAGDVQLAFPLDCTLGQDCHIQQYMDQDPSAAAHDYRCSRLTYDGHKGTDFALPDRAAMAAGVTVRAAAAGVVKGLRDGMADGAPLSKVQGRECGNGVVIDLGRGWETQYCHLKRGSLRVTDGQEVAVGDALGLVGQSGKAAFPHLHLSLRHNGNPVDPFAPEGNGCEEPAESLWQDTPPYRPGGLIALGFADRIPSYDEIKAGDANHDTLPKDAPALVIYGYSYGTQKNDVLRLSLAGPSGTVIERDVVLEKPQAQSFRAIGKRAAAGTWPAGRYRGTVTLLRDGRVIDEKTGALTLQ
ncbi:MAG: M23 family metallopeptidase [Sulfitobacter sp.]